MRSFRPTKSLHDYAAEVHPGRRDGPHSEADGGDEEGRGGVPELAEESDGRFDQPAGQHHPVPRQISLVVLSSTAVTAA